MGMRVFYGKSLVARSSEQILVCCDKNERRKLLGYEDTVRGQSDGKWYRIISTKFLPTREGDTQRDNALIYG